MVVLVTGKYLDNTIKMKTLECLQDFPDYNPMGAVFLPWKLEFRSDFVKNLMQVSPLPMMLHIKFDCNWHTGFRDIHVSEIFMFHV